MVQESHPYQHFAAHPIIDRDLVPLYDLSPAAYQRIVNDLVNLVGAVFGYAQQRGGEGLAQAAAVEANAIWGMTRMLRSGCRQSSRRSRSLSMHGACRDSAAGARCSTNIGDQGSAP